MISNDPSARAVRLPLALLMLLIITAAISGGLNRGDVIIVMVVRLMAVICLAAAIVKLSTARLQGVRIPLALLALLAIWMVLQLVPLPPSIWTTLPGRERLASAANTVGMPQPWMAISIVPMRTLNSLLALLIPAAALVMTAWLPKETWMTQIRIIVAVGVVSAVLALVQISGSPDSSWYLYNVRQKGGAVGLFANRNHQAVLLATMFPMLAVLGVRAARVRGRGLAVALSCMAIAIFLLPLIFITGSRGGLVVAAVSLIATMALVWPFMRKLQLSRKWLAVGGGLVAIVALGLVATLLSDRSLAMKRLTETDVGEEQRVLVVEPIVRLIRENLPIGTGFGTFDPAFRAIEPYSQLFRTYLNHAHSDPLEFVSDGGVPAACILLAFVFWWLKTTFTIWARPRVGDTARMATIVTALLMISSLVDYPLRTPLAAMIFALLIGWMSRAVANHDAADIDVIDRKDHPTSVRRDREHRVPG